MITQEEFGAWKSNPTTIEIFAEIRSMVTTLTASLTSGQTISGTGTQVIAQTSQIIGEIAGLNQILNINYKEGENV